MNPIQFRRHLHMHPELSFREHDTAAFISARLSELGIEHRPIAGTGVLAKMKAAAKPTPNAGPWYCAPTSTPCRSTSGTTQTGAPATKGHARLRPRHARRGTVRRVAAAGR
ncbi:MAG: hypothetical protein ACLRMJ_07875 [Alistipes finegoldii]